MKRVPRQVQQLAEHLVAHETGRKRPAGSAGSKGFPVFEKLRRPLAAIVGSTGFAALQMRALALARSEYPWLREVKVNDDGSLEGPAGLEAHETALRVTLFAHLIELLRTFIGAAVTMQLIREVWPTLELDDLR